MKQTKVSLKESHFEFLKKHSRFGFRDKSALMREALDHLEREILKKELEESALLYAEVYEADPDLKGLTESALTEWPE